MSNNRKYSINVHCYSYILKGLFHKYLEVFCLFVFKHLFIFGRAGSSLLHGLFCSCDSRASHCSDICCCGQRCRVHRLRSRGGWPQCVHSRALAQHSGLKGPVARVRSSQSRDKTCVPWTGRQTLNHQGSPYIWRFGLIIYQQSNDVCIYSHHLTFLIMGI